MDEVDLKEFSSDIRKEIVKMIGRAGSGHPGGSLSAADLLTVLFCKVLRYDPQNPSWKERDRFVLSKGHAAPLLYAVLAKCGYFPQETLLSFRQLGSILQGHPDSTKVPGVEISTGSLGQGLSIAGGIALGVKKKNYSSRVFVLPSDGELQEGQVWEAATAISHYKLNNLIAIIDNNNLQIDGTCEEVMNIYPIDDKFRAFGLNVININGHSFSDIKSAYKIGLNSDKPTTIVAKTVKGKGVSYMENKVEYHHAKNLSQQLVEQAIEELNIWKRGD